MSNRRIAIDVTPELLSPVLDFLPHRGAATQIVKYNDVTFKHNPKWSEVKPYVKCIQNILKLTDGRQINQVSCRDGIMFWVKKNDLQFNESTCEAAAYALRAMISQMTYFKRKTGVVPREYNMSFAAVFEAIQVLFKFEFEFE